MLTIIPWRVVFRFGRRQKPEDYNGGGNYDGSQCSDEIMIIIMWRCDYDNDNDNAEVR